MLEIEDITELPFDSKGGTKLIVIDKYDYNKFIENTAKLKAIENLAREDEVDRIIVYGAERNSSDGDICLCIRRRTARYGRNNQNGFCIY